ncbi:MAG: GNAT family N-acetyltransferase, partial [Candidatus Nanohaloarchaea archaeon]
MPVKTVETEEEIRELANLLSDYWSTREMEYSEDWTEDYIKQGHAEEILGDKFFIKTGEDGVSGSISLVFWSGGVAELRDFYVVEGERDSGIGEELLDRA